MNKQERTDAIHFLRLNKKAAMQDLLKAKSDNVKNAIHNEIKYYEAAIAALSKPEPLPFPSYDEFMKNKSGYCETRGEFSFHILFRHEGFIQVWREYRELSDHRYYINFELTESGYLAAIEQLNTWLNELYDEIGNNDANTRQI